MPNSKIGFKILQTINITPGIRNPPTKPKRRREIRFLRLSQLFRRGRGASLRGTVDGNPSQRPQLDRRDGR